MTNGSQISGIFRMVIGAMLLMSAGMILLQLVAAVAGLFFLISGIFHASGNQSHIQSTLYTWRSRFFGR